MANITWPDGVSVNQAGGFAGKSYSIHIGCYSGGTIKNTGWDFCGDLPDDGSADFIGCYSDVSGGGNFTNKVNYFVTMHSFTNCVYTGADNSSIPGIEGNVAPTAAYTKLTAGGTMTTVKTLHWSSADGYTLNVVSGLRTTGSFWKNVIGSAPIIDMASEAVVQEELYEGTPALALPLSVNYWVAPINKESNIAWSTIPDVNVVCPVGWKIPTKNECLEMLDLHDDTSFWPDYYNRGKAIAEIFGTTDQTYFTSTTEGSNVWTFTTKNNEARMSSKPQAGTTGILRCVKKAL